jgi:hypothetical protein
MVSGMLRRGATLRNIPEDTILQFKIGYDPFPTTPEVQLLQIERSRVRFLALPDFLSSSGPEMAFTQPPEDN